MCGAVSTLSPLVVQYFWNKHEMLTTWNHCKRSSYYWTRVLSTAPQHVVLLCGNDKELPLSTASLQSHLGASTMLVMVMQQSCDDALAVATECGLVAKRDSSFQS
jgi:hypothetical protein